MPTLFDFLSPISFELPDWRPDGTWTEHGPFAAWLIEQARPRLVVELGVFAGYSLMAMAQAAQRASLETRLIGIDTWAGDEHGGFYSQRFFDELKVHVAARHAQHVELRRMTFAEALPGIPDGSIDILHVDGRHFYDDVREDFESYIPKLSPRAVVLFHDTQVRDKDFGVYRYWAELAGTHDTFEFHHGNGLGVLRHGTDAPAALKALCARHLEPAIADQVRMAYERLGQGVDGRRASEKRKREADERRARRKDPVKFAQHVFAKVTKR